LRRWLSHKQTGTDRTGYRKSLSLKGFVHDEHTIVGYKCVMSWGKKSEIIANVLFLEPHNVESFALE
jgi:hypothetical protein